MLSYLLYYPAELLGLGLLLAVALRVRVDARLQWGAAILALAACVVRPLAAPPEMWDYDIFYNAGAAVWNGADPYDNVLVLNPPTALPIFALLALPSREVSGLVFTYLNLAGSIGVAVCASLLLRAQARTEAEKLAPATVALLAAVVSLAPVCRFSMEAGQLSILTALALFAALLAQEKEEPWLAGALLALATIKTATMLPFLLLFLRRTDWQAWASMIVVSLALCVAATPPLELPDRCRHGLANISTLAQEGHVNDYAFGNKVSIDIVALDHFVYRLGVRDRGTVRIAQLLALGSLGIFVAWKVVGPGRWPRGAACSLVALYSTLFLYHRFYDFVILTLPLAYAVQCAKGNPGPGRWFHVASVVVLLTAMSWRRAFIGAVHEWSDHVGLAGRLLDATLLSAWVWLILAAIVLLALAQKKIEITGRQEGGTEFPAPA